MKIKVQDKNSVDLLKVNFLNSKDVDLLVELNEAHEYYMKRKNEIITKLYTIWKNKEIPSVYCEWLRQAAKFIKEKDI